jgi:hypothetical protein
MIVRFDCGCVGLVGVQGVPEGEGQHLLLQACDADDSSLGLFPRDMSGKAHEPVSEEKARGLIQEMGRLMMDGYKFREVRNLLR